MYTRMNLIGTRQNKKQNITVSALESFILKQMKSSLTEKNLSQLTRTIPKQNIVLSSQLVRRFFLIKLSVKQG